MGYSLQQAAHNLYAWVIGHEEAVAMRVLKFSELKERGIPFSRMHIDRLEKDGLFPKRARIGKNTVIWVAAEIDAYVDRSVAERDNNHRDSELPTTA
jgi:prophage regulatory protein